MSSKLHYRKLERMYCAAPCNVYYAPEIHISEGAATVTIPIRENFFHAGHAVHGSVYFKAADDSAFFAASSIVEDAFVLTTNLNLYMTRPITEGSIIGNSRVVSATRNLILAESILTNAEGRDIGRATASFMRSAKPLSKDMGYTLDG